MGQAIEKMQDQSIAQMIQTIGSRAKQASYALATATAEQKNNALKSAAKSLRDNEEKIMTANAKDMEAAKANGISGAFLDRLELNSDRIEGMASGLEAIADLNDPVGEAIASWDRPNGLNISRVRVPLGVIGIIYESRPNVTADAGALCLKSGNAAILRGGSESAESSRAIAECLQEGLKAAGIPEDAIQLLPTQDRAAVGEMLKCEEFIDVIVPRGGKGLIQRITEESKIPLFKHLEGNCHSYIHENADKAKAVEIITNAKMRRTGICGATESVVVDEAVAKDILPALVDSLEQHNCEIRGDEKAVAADSRIKPASKDDFDTEYLDAIISIKTVSGIDEAIEWVNVHNSDHTDAIITENDEAAARYLNEIDSAIVIHNASTQFADGGEFGMGAEIGIATGKLHARGPVGVEQLTTFKYQVRGTGQTRPA